MLSLIDNYTMVYELYDRYTSRLISFILGSDFFGNTFSFKFNNILIHSNNIKWPFHTHFCIRGSRPLNDGRV